MQKNNAKTVTPVELKKWLHDGNEIALLDVREHGQYGEAHLFYVVSAPYSKLESEVNRLVPRKSVRMVLVDEDGGSLASLAAQRLQVCGYSDIQILEGGVQGWKRAGYELFAGVNLPSKTFGELAEHAFDTPRISATELNQKIEQGEDMIVLDGRPFTEFKKMSIPTATCCPNGELPLRIDDLIQSENTTIVINCAGRTRSIIGAQTLINLGIKNKVFALENGTQGWYLADFKLDHGKSQRHSLELNVEQIDKRQARARELAQKHNVRFVDHATVNQWLKDESRSTYLCDVRTPEEFAKGSLPGAQNTPGGQLVQATDQFVGAKGARLVLIDSEGVRAPAMASWLEMMGWDVAVLTDALKPSANAIELNSSQQNSKANVDIKKINTEELSAAKTAGAKLIDLRPSMKYRESHIDGAQWSIRGRLISDLNSHDEAPVVLLVDDDAVAQSAQIELQEHGVKNISVNNESVAQWKAAGLAVVATPDNPPDAQCIDYLFFVHDRHDGNKAAARQYLAWEMNLLAQIDDQERNSYRLPQHA